MRKQKDDMQVNVAGLRRNIKNLAHNYSDAQVKVREATSNDPWGPSATIMAEIADLTYNVVAFSEIMQMIWKRLNDHGKNWRHVYKALILLEYLIKTGTEKVAQQCKENIFAIQTLREFVYFEEGKDQGTHVREKAKQLVNLLKDDERLKNERVKALKAKERFALHPSGFGSDGYIDGPSQRDLPPGWQEEPPKNASELEMVRPQTAGEEELQLQLAMAMSREEAEQEEAKRRSDDVRLQLALSQSEQDFNPTNAHRDPSGRPVAAPKKEEQQSHLLDLLDISLGATSISSPPLGAAGGAPIVDPWAAPTARSGSQLSDPWPVQPWRPDTVAAPRTIMSTGVPLSSAAAPAQVGDAWCMRTQSPSVASGSSNEGWLQTNGNASQNGRMPAPAPLDPWLTKSTANAGLVAAAPPSHGANNASSNGVSADPWLAEPQPAAAPPATPADPWAAAQPAATAALDDPWKAMQTGAVKKQSPDFDEFDLITNRNKSAEHNSNASNNNNNNASLLDDMDPLSTNYGNNGVSVHPSTGATTKKPYRDPLAFLGENSALVNLDNLIKPNTPQTQSGLAPAYNPFADNVMPPKTNLFQQQQPAVPSINQLKQQPPFPVNMNQDPWAPVSGGVSAASQAKPLQPLRPTSLKLSDDFQLLSVFNKPPPIVSSNPQPSTQLYHNNNNNNNNIISDNNNSYNYGFNRSYNSPAIDSIRNMDILNETQTEQRSYFPSPTAPSTGQYSHSSTPGGYSSYTQCYSSALSESLAETPGISISPIVYDDSGFYGNSSNTSASGNYCKLEQNNNMPWIKPEATATNPFLS
ncbi:epsin-1 isoform X4 [Drosophila grimshawi]|uniref:epsin-1 isoform X4 n=1 Tax=Drosophila grimshawi TaxID=7222 RepID=UPI000C870273|nr:epsin-1 isoform X4 [Drosophila grimshawi]